MFLEIHRLCLIFHSYQCRWNKDPHTWLLGCMVTWLGWMQTEFQADKGCSSTSKWLHLHLCSLSCVWTCLGNLNFLHRDEVDQQLTHILTIFKSSSWAAGLHHCLLFQLTFSLLQWLESDLLLSLRLECLMQSLGLVSFPLSRRKQLRGRRVYFGLQNQGPCSPSWPGWHGGRSLGLAGTLHWRFRSRVRRGSGARLWNLSLPPGCASSCKASPPSPKGSMTAPPAGVLVLRHLSRASHVPASLACFTFLVLWLVNRFKWLLPFRFHFTQFSQL